MLVHSYFFPRPEVLIGGRKNKILQEPGVDNRNNRD